MSIATVGPAKYDFQDLVCIKFALQFYKKKTASLIVEGDGAEDAELAFQTNENSVVYEIQVKGSMQHYGMPLREADLSRGGASRYRLLACNIAATVCGAMPPK